MIDLAVITRKAGSVSIYLYQNSLLYGKYMIVLEYIIQTAIKTYKIFISNIYPNR
jgi:hypothetical protein